MHCQGGFLLSGVKCIKLRGEKDGSALWVRGAAFKFSAFTEGRCGVGQRLADSVKGHTGSITRTQLCCGGRKVATDK